MKAALKCTFMFAIVIPVITDLSLTVPVLAQVPAARVLLHLKDPGGNPLPGARLEIYKVTSEDIKAAAMSQVTVDSTGTADLKLPIGGYLVAVKHYSIKGDIATHFDGDFYPLVSFVRSDGKDREETLTTLKMELRNCKIGSTDDFIQYYEPLEAGKRKRLEMVPGHAGRLIMMEGAPICSLQIQYPESARGPRGLQTYTPTGGEMLEDGTVHFKTFSYDGAIKNAHDIMYLGASYTPDKKNRLLIDNIQKKSGVEVPLEPKAHILNDGRLTGFISNISFISDEKKKPATLVFTYFYLDDPEHTKNLEAMVSVEP